MRNQYVFNTPRLLQHETNKEDENPVCLAKLQLLKNPGSESKILWASGACPNFSKVNIILLSSPLLTVSYLTFERTFQINEKVVSKWAEHGL